MESQDMVTGFTDWLKGLSGGEATLYITIFTMLISFLVWVFKGLMKRRACSSPNSKNEADKKNKDFPEVSKIDFKQVKATKGSIAVGVNIGGEISQKGKQDET